MIDSVVLRGFKSYLDASLKLRELTILTGINSSGKSTLIQALRIAERVANAEKNPLLEGYGSYLELRNPKVDEWSLEVSFSGGTVIFPNGTADVNFPNVIYVSADRMGPQLSISANDTTELGSRGENVLKCIDTYQNELLSHYLVKDLERGETFGYNLQLWLDAISPNMKFEWNIQRKSDSSYCEFDGHRSLNVGFGMSYTLPIIVALFMGTLGDNKVVILENPEAHLHPKGQTEMGRLIALSAKAGAQVIVETHSDHLFDGIRLATKELGDGFSDKIQTYWFEKDEDKVTHEVECNFDDRGSFLRRCPKGFFDQFEINSSSLLF